MITYVPQRSGGAGGRGALRLRHGSRHLSAAVFLHLTKFLWL